MGTKLNPGKFDCYHNALPDEPMFILLARDPYAPQLVTQWAMKRAQDVDVGRRPTSDDAMVVEATHCANAMTEWRAKNDGRWRTERAPGDSRADLLAALEAMIEPWRDCSTAELKRHHLAGSLTTKTLERVIQARTAIARAKGEPG